MLKFLGTAVPEDSADTFDFSEAIRQFSRSCGWPHGDEIIRNVKQRCHISEFLIVLSELETRVKTMGISSRFKRDMYARESLGAPENNFDLFDFHAGKKLNEAGHKRSALLATLRSMRREFEDMVNKLEIALLDIEATNMDDDGNLLPDPTAEELAVDDFLLPREADEEQ